jgi:choline dehydrogenase-like flavoprotein
VAPDLIVGSGPSGVACAIARLERGRTVWMLDAGLTLESGKQEQVKRLAQLPPEAWTSEDAAFVRGGAQATSSGVSRKLVFGSPFSYALDDAEIPVAMKGAEIVPSFARGGLSTVWGAAVLPVKEQDISDWPITRRDLEPGYRAVLKHLPYAASHDALAEDMPLYGESDGPLPLSAQAAAFLSDAGRHQSRLAAEGVQIGRARLAAVGGTSHPSACRRCGLCLYGCAYGTIYSSADTLETLLKNPRFRYVSDVIVKTVEETSEGVTVRAKQRDNGAVVSFDGDRVFLAAGVVPTARIVLESLRAFDQPVQLSTSQHLLFPLIRYRGTPNVMTERLHALAHAFIEINHPSVSDKTVHLQVYSYNDFYPKVLKEMHVATLASLVPGGLNAIVSRLLIVQGYVHSQDADKIQATLRPPTSGGEPVLELTAVPNPSTRPLAKRALRHLRRFHRELGAFPVATMLKVSLPGQAFHNGGSFPMKRTPKGFECDTLGRPARHQRLHVVDASVLPSVPATTITLTVMANAYRIGAAA